MCLLSSHIFNQPTTVNGLYYFVILDQPYDAQSAAIAGHLTFEVS